MKTFADTEFHVRVGNKWRPIENVRVFGRDPKEHVRWIETCGFNKTLHQFIGTGFELRFRISFGDGSAQYFTSSVWKCEDALLENKKYLLPALGPARHVTR